MKTDNINTIESELNQFADNNRFKNSRKQVYELMGKELHSLIAAEIKTGANWQQQKDKAIIDKLMGILKFIVNDAEEGEDAKLTVTGYNKACAIIQEIESDNSNVT